MQQQLESGITARTGEIQDASCSIAEELKQLYKAQEQEAQTHRLLIQRQLSLHAEEALDTKSSMTKGFVQLQEAQAQLLQSQRQLSEQECKVLEICRQNRASLKEIEWADIYNNTVSGSSWLKDNSFSPGRWAVGYPFLYVLYRSLEEAKPTSVLEMGLGQSTRMITQYAAANAGITHTVIEQNAQWVDFFKQTYCIADNTCICVLPCVMESYGEAPEVRVYDGFMTAVAGRCFDFVCIDAPSAEGMDLFSRIDVLKLLPHQLAERFIILLDDCNRTGEANTSKEISRLLADKGIPFRENSYQGEKNMHIWTSADLSFLCTM